MANLKKKRDAREKAKIALEAIKGDLTATQISSKYSVSSGQISTWKKQLLEGAVDIFSGKHVKLDKDSDELVQELYKLIGQLSAERDWLKKIWLIRLKIGVVLLILMEIHQVSGGSVIKVIRMGDQLGANIHSAKQVEPKKIKCNDWFKQN